MEKFWNVLKNYWVILLLALVFAAAIILYLLGWRLGPGGLPVQTGTLELAGVPEGTAVYIDQARRVRATGGSASIELTPGTHTVIVDAPGALPWNELFSVESGTATALAPILIPAELPLRALHGDERATAATAIFATLLPTKATPLLLSGGCAHVFVSENRIVATATTTPSCTPPPFLLCPIEEGGARTEPCASPTVIFSPNERLGSITRMPGREDALVIAAGGSSYVVELDPRSPQFFAPILKGPQVRGAPWSESSIIISDTKQIYELSL